MACGTPAIAFGVGGVPEIVRTGTTGIQVEPGDTKQFTAAIVRLLENAPALAGLRVQCRETALKEYSFGLHVERHLVLYRQALEPIAV
jgi:glycosyltransferase involved in cell wall biosynthesis